MHAVTGISTGISTGVCRGGSRDRWVRRVRSGSLHVGRGGPRGGV